MRPGPANGNKLPEHSGYPPTGSLNRKPTDENPVAARVTLLQ